MMERLFVGMDIGGTNLRCALVDSRGVILDRHRAGSRIEEGRDAFCELMLSEISVLTDAAVLRGKQVSAIGIGVPGLIGSDGLIRSSVNMQPLEGFNLAAFVKNQTGLPTVCANDANVIALGEQRFGAGRGLSSCMMITIGTGLGSGLILDGRLWTGSGGFAAEFGHITVDPAGYLCPCGNRGCLEQYVSAGALVRFASELLPEYSTETLRAEFVADLAWRGNPSAMGAFDQLGSWLGIGLASLANTLNIQAVIIGGGVAASFELILPSLRRTIKERCFPQIYEGLAIEKASLGDDAGLLGSAALADELSVSGFRG
ncbi:MAG: ROK family protein [Desulfuromonadales bacterium]|nr:ROK family protein [Desulfuromonadales bacterium]